MTDPEFSFGVLIPLLVAYLLWQRKGEFAQRPKSGENRGLVLTIVGCALQVLASYSGTLLLSGIALVIVILGVTLYLWGSQCLRIAAGPITVLVLMVPVPSYVVGGLTWQLQGMASGASSGLLRQLGTPVLQEGNILRLPNYVLEVKQACSGSRSLFALIALSLVIGLASKGKWWVRVLLFAAAPLLAVGTNIIRIVGTGLIARRWGAIAADESLHLAWGIMVFVVAVLGLFTLQRFLAWTDRKHA